MGISGDKTRRKKPTSRETLKKPPGLISKSTPFKGERGEGEKMKEKMRAKEVYAQKWESKRMWSCVGEGDGEVWRVEM